MRFGLSDPGPRAVAVETAGGDRIRARRAVIADVSAPALYAQLLPTDAVPARILADLDRFTWDTPVVKLDWALAEPIPWRAPGLSEAGTVHLGADSTGLVRWSADIETGTLPQSPFQLFGQMTTTDPTRSPTGTESARAYTHLPRGVDDDAAADVLAERTEDLVEAHAPGFRDRILHRVLQRPRVTCRTLTPTSCTEPSTVARRSCSNSWCSGRCPASAGPRPRSGNPLPGQCGRPPWRRCGGVHGVCGFLAARAALGEHGWGGGLRRRITSAALDIVHRPRRS
jgi:hypothetical protein